MTKNVSKLGLSSCHGHLSENTKFMQDMVQEVCGFTPYGQHTTELFKVSKNKRARNSSRKEWGHTSVPRGREGLSNGLAVIRKKAGKKD